MIARRVSLQDVASAAGVSKGLASRALADYPEVAADTRERVGSLARAMGYRASARARALAAGKNAPARCLVASLGLAPDALGRSFYGPILTGITAQASTEGLDIQLAALPGEPEHAAGMLAQLVAEDRADGVILLTFFPLTAGAVQPLEAAGIPFVLVNRYIEGHPVNCVTPDWAGATSRAVTHLVGLGHRHLALFLPDVPVSTVRDHAAGWWEGVARCGIAVTDAPVLRFAGQESGAFDLARLVFAGTVLDADHTPTAIVCMNDVYAHGVLTAAADAGLAVPAQISVIGFDDIFAQYVTPPLCSFNPHLYDVGAKAAAVLAAALRGELAEPHRVLMPLDFVCRSSCGPAPECASPAAKTTFVRASVRTCAMARSSTERRVKGS